jgi:hypothetical protein
MASSSRSLANQQGLENPSHGHLSVKGVIIGLPWHFS